MKIELDQAQVTRILRVLKASTDESDFELAREILRAWFRAQQNPKEANHD